MKGNDNENIYRHIAERYIDKMGQELLDEQNSNSNNLKHIDTANLDRRVYKGLNKGKGSRIIKFAVSVAACILLVFAIPVFRWINENGEINKSSDMPSQENFETQVENELIPLSFSLPLNMEVKDKKEDNGMSIYYLEDTFNDDVVMQLERKGADFETEKFTEINIDGYQVYGFSEDNYNMIKFEYQEITYTMTCRYDINTLTGICKKVFSI